MADASSSSRPTYLGLWFDGAKDVWKQRFRTQRAVESDHSSQERPEHHYDVDISADIHQNIM